LGTQHRTKKNKGKIKKNKKTNNNSSQFTTSVHWPWYCTVHSYVVLQCCDDIWSFWVAVNLCSFFRLFIYVYISCYQGEVWESTCRFNPDTLLRLPEARTWIYNVICRCPLFYFLYVKVKGDCLFCWYWWNCWPSLFKLSFHNKEFMLLW
jgi:hypothetical protein